MNIRSLSNPAQVLAKDQIEASRGIKSDETAEREANGQQPHADAGFHRALTDEEVEQVLSKLRSNEGIQKSGLIVKHEKVNNQNIVKLESPSGDLVKRFVERDLYFHLFQDSKDGLKLVNRTA